MLPIEPLMMEHRLIKKMIASLAHELVSIKEGQPPDIILLEKGGDFLINYAARIHQGKEEIMFRYIDDETISPTMRGMVKHLVRDHERFREATWALRNDLYAMSKGESRILEIGRTLAFLTRFYPEHITTENDGFFIAIMELLSRDDMDRMLNEFQDHDRGKDQWRYHKMIEHLSSEGAENGSQ